MGPRRAFAAVFAAAAAALVAIALAGAAAPTREPRSSTAGDAARPDRGGDTTTCSRDTSGRLEFWMPFRDAGRHFYALVVIGRDAPTTLRDQAFAILDRLRFDPAVRPRRHVN